jgi:hypothetical protein
LHERIHFIKNPDKVVGQLLLDFADLVSKQYSVKEAIPFFIKATTYDSSLEWKIQARLRNIKFENSEEEVLNKKDRNKNILLNVVWLIIGAGITLIILKLMKLKK